MLDEIAVHTVYSNWLKICEANFFLMPVCILQYPMHLNNSVCQRQITTWRYYYSPVNVENFLQELKKKHKKNTIMSSCHNVCLQHNKIVR